MNIWLNEFKNYALGMNEWVNEFMSILVLISAFMEHILWKIFLKSLWIIAFIAYWCLQIIIVTFSKSDDDMF